jgi:hypothetical protein
LMTMRPASCAVAVSGDTATSQPARAPAARLAKGTGFACVDSVTGAILQV